VSIQSAFPWSFPENINWLVLNGTFTYLLGIVFESELWLNKMSSYGETFLKNISYFSRQRKDFAEEARLALFP